MVCTRRNIRTRVASYADFCKTQRLFRAFALIPPNLRAWAKHSMQLESNSVFRLLATTLRYIAVTACGTFSWLEVLVPLGWTCCSDNRGRHGN